MRDYSKKQGISMSKDWQKKVLGGENPDPVEMKNRKVLPLELQQQ